MKKHIKIISLLSLFVIASTTFFIFAKRPADDKPETIILRIFMIPQKNEAWVDYGSGKIIETEIAGWGASGSNLEKFKLSESKVLEIVQKLNSNGYKVISQSESAQGTEHYETWVLTLK